MIVMHTHTLTHIQSVYSLQTREGAHTNRSGGRATKRTDGRMHGKSGGLMDTRAHTCADTCAATRSAYNTAHAHTHSVSVAGINAKRCAHS